MEIDQATAEQLTQQATKQTQLLQGLYNIALVWSVLAVIGLLTWVFVAANS